MYGDKEHAHSQLEQKMASSSLGQLPLPPGHTVGLPFPDLPCSLSMVIW